MANKKNTKKTQTSKKSAAHTIRREVKDSVLAVVFFALTLVLLLSVYKNTLGIFGAFISAFTHGAVGAVSFILPFFTLWLGVSLIKPEFKMETDIKLWTGFFLMLSLSGVCYLFEESDWFGSYTFTQFFTKGIPEMVHRAGGVLGGLIAYPLICILTKVGFAILFVTIAIICALTFFDVTLHQIWSKINEHFEDKDESEVPAVRAQVVDKPKRHRNIDVFVDDEPVTDEPEPEPEPEIIVDGDDVEIKPFSSIPFFVHDDIDPNEYITTADIREKPEKKKTETPLPDSSAFEPEQTEMYIFPPKDLLETPKNTGGITKSELMQTEAKLVETLKDFGIDATMVGAAVGPIVTRYELAPSKGVRVSKITSLADDIALSLAATSIRIEAPIPGKAAVGIEVPNKKKSMVYIKELLDGDEFVNSKNPLTVALGKDISGNLVYGDLSDMPHLLVAGATGSGKSVCINTILMSLLYKASPEDVKLILIDPKVVELEVYNKIPHLIVPVVSNPKKAAGALQWAVNEMERRYNLFFSVNVRNIHGYNEYASKHSDVCEKIPQIVIVIDELADLMMVCAKEVEDYIVRLCQKARAAGIYLIIATQRPSVNVVTGLIKANVPSRIAFAVTSQIDSRVILDGSGAEKLLGKGDMLFKGRTMGSARRIQCCFVSDSEVESVVEYIKKYSGTAVYDQSANDAMENYSNDDKKSSSDEDRDGEDLDEMFWPAVQFVIESGKASTSNLQRKFKLGYARAARIIDIMEEKGIIGAYEGAKPRQVIMTMSEYNETMARYED